VIRQQIAHKYGRRLTASDVRGKDIWDDLFRIAEFLERDGKSCCQLVPFWHVETSEAKQFKIERIIPFYPYSRDRAKLSSILRTLAIYRLAFGQPRQSELIEHLLKHMPEDKIGEVRKKLMIDLSPISNGGLQSTLTSPAAKATEHGDSETRRAIESAKAAPPVMPSATSHLDHLLELTQDQFDNIDRPQLIAALEAASVAAVFKVAHQAKLPTLRSQAEEVFARRWGPLTVPPNSSTTPNPAGKSGTTSSPRTSSRRKW
jgi:hypothetical protein